MSPRGRRQASVLQAAGHEVTLSGVCFDPHLADMDRELMHREGLCFSAALDLRASKGRIRRLRARARGRCARTVFRFAGLFSPTLLGYGVAEQLKEARRRRADLTIVHSEAGLWIARELLRDGQNVGVDFEDWFSRDLSLGERRARPVRELAELEETLLQHASYRLASSSAMARALSSTYHVSAPAVVTNAGQKCTPLVASNVADDPTSPLRLHWFSQTIGPARGLELLAGAFPLLRHPVQVTLRGICGTENRAWLERTIPASARSTVTIAPPVAPWELPQSVAEHQVGLALETTEIPSRDLCISNKLFQYLASGLAVIATDTQGQREAMAPCPDAGTLLAENTPHGLAHAIDAYATYPRRLAHARRAAQTAAEGPWNGEQERQAIAVEAARALGWRESADAKDLFAGRAPK